MIRELGVKNSHQILTIIMDGMDQNKTIIPHTAKPVKSLETMFRLQTFVTGVLIHNKKPHSMAYISPPTIAHDANCVLTCLIQTLITIQNSYTIENSAGYQSACESDSYTIFNSRSNVEQKTDLGMLSQLVSRKQVPNQQRTLNQPTDNNQATLNPNSIDQPTVVEEKNHQQDSEQKCNVEEKSPLESKREDREEFVFDLIFAALSYEKAS